MESSAAQRLKANQNVKVYVRVRPTNARERNIRSMEVVEVPSNKDVVIHQSTDSRTTKKFSFDRAFGPDSKQNEVYHTVVAPMIEEVLAGYNCTVFAYGQTGTGKTHTMVGEEAPELNTAWDDDSDLGIIPRALSHLFDELRMREVEFTMRVSYLELYNEELCDLLSTDDTVKIRIFDDATKKGSVIVQGLEEIPVHSKDDVYKLLAKGQERRRTACTLMNAQSSRSHTIFSILVHIKENGIEGEDMLKIGKLNLVDLAGSENISKAGNEKGARTRETVNINQSLLTLGRVITALVERGPHIPYRESKLTRLLQESLGGRTKTAIIATISPGHKDLEETLSTLDYAHRAKNIQNKPEINQRLTKKTVLKEYTEEIDRLKRDLIAARDKNGIYLAEDTYNQMTFQLDSQTRELNEKIMIIRALKDEMTKKQELFKEVSLNLIECTNELKHTESKLTTTKVVLNQAKQVLVKTKRRYDEKKKIIEHHVETEQQLTSQANNIISVADVAVKHTDHLHKAIVRHRDTHETAKSVCDKFANTMNQRFVSMSSSMDEFVKFSSKTTQEIEDELNESVVTNNKRLAAIKRHINKVEEVATESTDLINITLNAYQSKTKEWSSAQRDTLHAILVDIVIEKDKCIEKFQSMTEYFKNKSRESLEAVEQYRQWIQTHQLRTSTFCHDHVATLQRTSTELNAFFQTMGNEFTQNVDESEAIAAKTQELIDEMNRLQQRKLTNHANMRKLISTIDGEKSKNSSTLQAHSTTISEYNQNQQTSHEIGAMLAESLHTITDSCTEHAITSVEPNSDLDVCLQTNVQDLIAKAQFEINNGCSALDSQLCVLVETAAKQGVDNNDQLMEHTNALSLESEHSIEFLSSKLTLLNSCNKHLTQSVQELDATSKEHITIAQHTLDEFKHKEMPVYKPSGETPVRRNFSYPRELASTSPHDRIISRVRLENEWSDLDTTAPEFELDDTLDSTTDTLENVTEEGIQPLSDISKEFSLNIPLQNMGLKSANSTPNSFSTMNEFNKENTITQE